MSLKFEFLYSVADALHHRLSQTLPPAAPGPVPATLMEVMYYVALHFVPPSAHPQPSALALAPQHLVLGLVLFDRYLSATVHSRGQGGGGRAGWRAVLDVYAVCVGLALKLSEDACLRLRSARRLVDLLFAPEHRYTPRYDDSYRSVSPKAAEAAHRWAVVAAMHSGLGAALWEPMTPRRYASLERHVAVSLGYVLHVSPKEFGQCYVRCFRQHMAAQNLSGGDFGACILRARTVHRRVEEVLSSLGAPPRSPTRPVSSTLW